MRCVSHFDTEQWAPFAIEKVFRFFANPGNLPRIMPPSTGTELIEFKIVAPAGMPTLATVTDEQPIAGLGSEIVTSFRVHPFLPFRARWTALITEFEWNHHFADAQKKGPLKSFHHRHELERELRDGVEGTLVRDKIDYEIGFGAAGRIVDRLFLSRQLQKTFAYRQRRVLQLLRRT